MFKKKFLVAILTVFALMLTVLTGCYVSSGPTSSESEESVESVESQETPSSEVEGNLQVPTFEISSIEATTTSITFEVAEEDPDDVGEITAIVLSKGSNKIEADDMETRTFDGLLSGEQYTVTVTYTYNVGKGDVSEDYKKSKYTTAMRVPEVEIFYSSPSSTAIEFELDITDKSNILEILSISLIPEDGGDAIILDDLSLREFTEIPCGFYELVVEYQYDLNKGDGYTQGEVRLAVATQIDPLTIPDFVVEVEEGRNPVILQITDTQIIDSSQYSQGIVASYYTPENFGVRLENYLRETVEAVQPDLIIMTGDNVYGKFDNSGASLTKLIALMESFEIPWAPVFGNHDNESAKGVAWQCAQYEAAEYCLFKRNTLTGNGNYTVGIAQGGKLTRVFFMMDSNGCGSPSMQSTNDGQMRTYAGFADDQIAWFEEVGGLLNTHTPDTKISFAFHIQIHAFATAYSKYGYSNSNNVINIDQHPDLEDGDMGYIGSQITGAWDTSDSVFARMKAIGCDSIYVGHEHNMSASVVYDGVRFQFGQKIGTYDGVNWLRPNGTVEFEFSGPGATGDPIMGGSVNVLDETGAIVDAYIYFCGGISHNGRQV